MLQQDDELRICCKLVGTPQIPDNQPRIIAMADPIDRPLVGRAVVEQQAECAIANGHLADSLDHQLPARLKIIARQDVGQPPPGFNISIDARNLSGKMVSQQPAADGLDGFGGEPMGRRTAVADRLGMRHIVAEPLAVPCCMDRTHCPPVAIDDQALQQAARGQLGTADCVCTERCENSLRFVEHPSIDDGLMLARVDSPLVLDLTDTQAVGEQAAQ